MKRYKLNDIYVLRPMTLVKELRYDKIKFPYNLICLFRTNSDCYLRLLEDAGKTQSKYIFETSDDIALAIKDEQSQYIDVFNGQVYQATSVNDLDRDDIKEEILFSEYVGNLATLKCDKAKQECFGEVSCDNIEYDERYLELMQQFAGIRYEILHSEVTLEELKELKRQLIDLRTLILEITLEAGSVQNIIEKSKKRNTR